VAETPPVQRLALSSLSRPRILDVIKNLCLEQAKA
jgi:hypothetical protein